MDINMKNKLILQQFPNLMPKVTSRVIMACKNQILKEPDVQEPYF